MGFCVHPCLGGLGREQLLVLCLRSPHLTGPTEHTRNVLPIFWVLFCVIVIVISRPQPLHRNCPNYVLAGNVLHLPMLSTVNSGSQVSMPPPASNPVINEALSPLCEAQCWVQYVSPCMGSQHLWQAQVRGPCALSRDSEGPHPQAAPHCHWYRSHVGRNKLSQP